MNFEKEPTAPEEPSKRLRNVVAGASLLGAIGMPAVASAADVAMSPEGQVYKQKEALSALPSETQNFLRTMVGKARDSGVELWKKSGKVPQAWESLTDNDLHLVVVYMNKTMKNRTVSQLLDAQVGYLPAPGLAKIIQEGVKEIARGMGYSEKGDPSNIGGMLWGVVAQKTIYNLDNLRDLDISKM